MYVYLKTNQTLWTVGFYDPQGQWQPESDHGSREDARKRVAFLNGGGNASAIDEAIKSKDNEIYELESKVKKLNADQDFKYWAWQQHELLPDNDFRKDLPVPRLEMMCKDGDGGSLWVYGIVKVVPWSLDNEVAFMPISLTRTSATDLTEKPYMPFRDNTHIRMDSLHLDLPFFVTVPSKKMIVNIAKEPTHENTVKRVAAYTTLKRNNC